MRRNRGIAIAMLLTFLIGFILAVQMAGGKGEEQGGLVPLAKINEYEAQLKEVTNQKESAMRRLKKLEAEMAVVEKKKAGDDDAVRIIAEENERNKLMSGMLDVYGPGISVLIEDPPVSDLQDKEGFSLIAYNYEFLLSLINKLKEAGAEAININGQRVVQNTEISLAGSNININGKATAQPYTINAIGNGDTLESAITIRAGIVEQMKQKGLIISVVQTNKLVIAGYDGTVDFQYAHPAVNTTR